MNVFVEIGDGVEVAAEDVAKFFENMGADIKAAMSPQALLSLAVLASAAAPVVGDVSADVSEGGLNIPLDIATAKLMIQTWPEFIAWVKTLAIRPTATTKPPTAPAPPVTQGGTAT